MSAWALNHMVRAPILHPSHYAFQYSAVFVCIQPAYYRHCYVHLRYTMARRVSVSHACVSSPYMCRSRAYAFLESAGTARVAVTRVAPEGGSLDHPLRVHYRTEDGDAVAGLDYEVGPDWAKGWGRTGLWGGAGGRAGGRAGRRMGGHGNGYKCKVARSFRYAG